MRKLGFLAGGACGAWALVCAAGAGGAFTNRQTGTGWALVVWAVVFAAATVACFREARRSR